MKDVEELDVQSVTRIAFKEFLTKLLFKIIGIELGDKIMLPHIHRDKIN